MALGIQARDIKIFSFILKPANRTIQNVTRTRTSKPTHRVETPKPTHTHTHTHTERERETHTHTHQVNITLESLDTDKKA